MRVISEMQHRIEVAGLQELPDSLKLLDNNRAARRVYKAPLGPNSGGEIEIIQNGDFTGPVDCWPASPKVGWNVLLERVVVQQGQKPHSPPSDIKEINVSGRQRVLVLGTGLDLQKVSSQGGANVKVRTSGFPDIRVNGGRVKLLAVR